MSELSSLLVIPITDKQTCFATQLIWILDRYGVLYMKTGVIGTLPWIPLSSLQDNRRALDFTTLCLCRG
jgi:hypothetical protein